MRLTQLAAAASLFLAIAAPLAADPGDVSRDGCIEVFAEGDSTWLPDPAGELGTFRGLINGSFFLTYKEEEGPTKSSAPNLVIKTEDGSLQLWMAGGSVITGVGTWKRKLVTLTAQGSGGYEGAKVDLTLVGVYVPEKGGTYQLFGTICHPAK